MDRRRKARSDESAAPASTLPGMLLRDAAAFEPPPLQAMRLRRLRRLVYRLGPFWFNTLVTLFVIAASVSITLMVNRFFPPPPEVLVFTLGMSVFIPVLVAPLVAWFIVRLVFEAENARRIAERLAVIDPLTQAFNRRHFFQVGERVFTQVRGGQHALSVLLLDIDNFKSVNDRHGHAVGDRVLKQVAQTCMDGMRENDLLARFGGEEFVVLLPATGVVEAAGVAERLRLAVERLAVAGDGDAMIRPTVSIGVATTATASLSLDGLLASADQAMYVAKRSGRNRVMTEAVPS